MGLRELAGDGRALRSGRAPRSARLAPSPVRLGPACTSPTTGLGPAGNDQPFASAVAQWRLIGVGQQGSRACGPKVPRLAVRRADPAGHTHEEPLPMTNTPEIVFAPLSAAPEATCVVLAATDLALGPTVQNLDHARAARFSRRRRRRSSRASKKRDRAARAAAHRRRPARAARHRQAARPQGERLDAARRLGGRRDCGAQDEGGEPHRRGAGRRT